MNQLDVNLEGKRGEDGRGTNMVDMIDPDTGMVLGGDDSMDDPPLHNVEDIREYLYQVDRVFLDPMTPEELLLVQDLTENLDAKTQEIADLLQNDEELETTFSRLTDQVEYRDFWLRYFVRLDEEASLRQTYQKYYPIKLQEDRQAEFERAGNALKSVTSFLGGAVKRIIQDSDDENSQEGDFVQGSSTKVKASSGMGFFQGTRRPPFVMNTAVSEDDEDEDASDGEEEELGWDDEDDEVEGEVQEEDDDKDGQIEFKDAEKERLQKALEQAMTERDLLHKTVEMQTEEIKKLREGVASKDESKQVEALKMQLFEKESELAAWRARLDDDEDKADGEDLAGDVARLQSELGDLKGRLSERDIEISRLRTELESHVCSPARATESYISEDSSAELQSQLDTALTTASSQKALLQSLEADKVELQEQIVSMKNSMEKILSESNALRKSQQAKLEAEGQSQSQLSQVQQQLESAEAHIEAIKSENQELRAALEQGELDRKSIVDAQKKTTDELALKTRELKEALHEMVSIKKELETSKEALQKALTASAQQPVRPSSPGSSSTGVKLNIPPVDPVPLEPVVTKLDANTDDDDDSDWGDW